MCHRGCVGDLNDWGDSVLYGRTLNTAYHYMKYTQQRLSSHHRDHILQRTFLRLETQAVPKDLSLGARNVTMLYKKYSIKTCTIRQNTHFQHTMQSSNTQACVTVHWKVKAVFTLPDRARLEKTTESVTRVGCKYTKISFVTTVFIQKETQINIFCRRKLHNTLPEENDLSTVPVLLASGMDGYSGNKMTLITGKETQYLKKSDLKVMKHLQKSKDWARGGE